MTANHYVLPRINNLLFLTSASLLAAALCLPPVRPPVAFSVLDAAVEKAQEPLRVEAKPQVGMAPLKLLVTVHQDIEALRDREVCVDILDEVGRVDGSCWSSYMPTLLVLRSFKLGAGSYVVQARVGKFYSVPVPVQVRGE